MPFPSEGSRVVRPFVPLTLSCLSVCACVGYRPAPIDPVSLSRSAATPPPGPLAFEDAVRFALEHNPDLLALRARAAAVNRSWFLEEISSESSEGVSVDVIGLTRIGLGGTEKALAQARFVEWGMRHDERAWEVAAEIAEAYEVERALASLPIADVSVPADAYVRAGLAPESAREAADANVAGIEAEASVRAALRRENRATLLRLLGARPDAPVEPALAPVLPDRLAEPTWDDLVRARPDLRREMATYRVADRELRRAVAEQYPHLVLSMPIGASDLLDVVGVTLPLRARAEARAAWAAREAARLEAKAAVLSAMRDARESRDRLAAAEAAHGAATRRDDANASLLRTARTRLEAEAGTFFESVFAAEASVDSAGARREAAVELARARVRAAKASGAFAVVPPRCALPEGPR
jgi:outer membrane protein TolC